MKFCHPEIESVLDTENGYYNTLVIEEQNFFTNLLRELNEQIQGSSGLAILSRGDVPVPMEKNAVVIDTFVPFDLNSKQLLSKIAAAMAQRAIAPENFEKTSSMLSAVELWLDDIAMDFPCDIVFSAISPASVIKSAAPEIRSDTDSVAEKVLDLIQLTEEFDRERLFFTVNMRSYVRDEDMELFVETILSHGYHVIGIESTARPPLTKEKRVIIDADLCEIS